jgi:hypothetical protein
MKVFQLINALSEEDPMDEVVIGYCSEGTYEIQRVTRLEGIHQVFLDGYEESAPKIKSGSSLGKNKTSLLTQHPK